MANKNARGRPIKVTDQIKTEYIRIKLGHPGWYFDEVYNELIAISKIKLKEDLLEEHADWPQHLINDEVNQRLPGKSVIRKTLEKRKSFEEIVRRFEADPKHKPWDMGSLVYQDLPGSALSLLLNIQKERRQKLEEPLTIREAWWAAHLCEIISTTKVHPRTQVIDFWTKRYASEQRLSEMLELLLDTTKLDNMLGNYAEVYARFSLSWDYVQKEKGLEATGELFCSLLEQKTIIYSSVESEHIDEKQLQKAEEALQETRRIWAIINNITDKAVLEINQNIKLKISSEPELKIYMQNMHGLDFENQIEKRIAELRKRLSERPKEAKI
ncbi:hypothetical protein ACFLTP_05195 [Chloroflexota bacterium]